MNKEKVLELEKQTAILFNKYGFTVPRRILPNIIFDWMTPEYCFKVRMRTLLSKLSHTNNFEVLYDGSIITENNDRKIMLLDTKNTDLIKEIKKDLLRKGIDLSKI